MATFKDKLQRLVDENKARFEGFDWDVEAEVKLYTELAEKLKPYVTDSIQLINKAHDGKSAGNKLATRCRLVQQACCYDNVPAVAFIVLYSKSHAVWHSASCNMKGGCTGQQCDP